MEGETTYRLTGSETVTVLGRSVPELLVEATYRPGGSPPPFHLHPHQDEEFEVLEGEVMVRIGKQEAQVRRAGERFEVARGLPHQMWNGSADTEARVRWATRPAGRTEEWFAAVDASGAARGKPDPLRLAPLLDEYDDTFRLAMPRPMALPLFKGLGLLGRLLRR